ncbi:MAG: hypothetical protein WCF85_14025 [Rhodospirillaceae bacterium]
MRRLVVYVVIATLCLATVLPGAGAFAQSPELDQSDSQLWRPQGRDLTLYMVGLGALMGVIAFNIAAPTVVEWGSSAVRSVGNIRAVAVASRQRLVASATGAAAPAVRAATPAVRAAAPTVATTTAATATGAAGTAARPAGGALVPPLTQSMLAQAQIGAVAAAAAGATVVYYLYGIYHWATGTAP